MQARRAAHLALRADVNGALAQRDAPLRTVLERCVSAVGTTFFIRLPLSHPAGNASTAA